MTRLLDLLATVWQWLIPVVLLGEEELGFVRRWGKYHRPASPGLVWTWPLVEHVCRVDGRLQVLDLPPQTFDSRTVSATFRVRIVDVRVYWSALADGWTELESAFAGIVGELAHDDQLDSSLLQRRSRAFAKGCGVYVEAASFKDHCKATPIRLLGLHQ